MNPMEKLDYLIGKTLFVPPIIRLCQAMGWTQYRFAAVAYLITNLGGFALSTTWVGHLIFGFGSIIAVIQLVFTADYPHNDSLIVRIFFLGGLFAGLFGAWIGATEGLIAMMWILFWLLIQQYAFTIKNIPLR